ncbi:hypothetical protein ACM46_11925 [Chryseobacterium angstadtii]|uniref:Uncharacterized protein n=1 Tax=Chryseobacterium angstadtii TaxID=558151 RepID=A0A0J7L781_9FLAO|nr:hypothetical protein [Chryseobacterium angstadtii]KMQ64910.1 hypothetical protein ACM46_11925 [Chryseobacterium angstadtii]
MKKTILFIILALSQIVHGQNKLFKSDNLTDTDSVKIIGMYPKWDKNKSYEKYNFLITDKKVIDSLIESVEYAEPTKNISEQNNFSIILTKGNKVINRWSISPKFTNININGSSRQFDISIVDNLSKKYFFKYIWYEKEFKNEKEFSKFNAEILKQEKTLYVNKPIFVYEGSFELQFPKNETFPHPKAIDEYLRPQIEKIVKEKKFSISYKLDEFNMKNRDQYTITVEGPYFLFTDLKEKNSKKGKWVPAKFIATVYEKE